jgi:hypothetical protein
MSPELAREIEKLRREAGLSMEELFAGLRKQRQAHAPKTGSGEQAR